MKKLLAVIIFIFIIITTNYAIGYSTDYIDFDVPDGYSVEESEDSDGNKVFSMSNVNNDGNISIYVSLYERDEHKIEYTHKNLNSYANTIINEIRSQSTVKGISLLNKELSTIGVAKYKCFSMELFSSYLVDNNNYNIYQKNYLIFADNYKYSILISSLNEDYLSSSAVSKVINNIEIKDSISEEKSFINNVISESLSSLIIVLILALFGRIFSKGKKNKTIIENDNITCAKRYCINCGHQLKENANFCNNCGNNIRKGEIEDVL